MDKTLKYAEMCSEADEWLFTLNREGKWESGDFYLAKCTDSSQVFIFDENEDELYDIYRPIWMPKQDQLQEYMIEEFVSTRKMMVTFGKYCEEYGDITFSGEQLWLSFLMREFHNKEWEGSEWVNIR